MAKKKRAPAVTMTDIPLHYSVITYGKTHCAIYLLGATIADGYRILSADGEQPFYTEQLADLLPLIQAHQEQKKRDRAAQRKEEQEQQEKAARAAQRAAEVTAETAAPASVEEYRPTPLPAEQPPSARMPKDHGAVQARLF